MQLETRMRMAHSWALMCVTCLGTWTWVCQLASERVSASMRSLVGQSQRLASGARRAGEAGQQPRQAQSLRARWELLCFREKRDPNLQAPQCLQPRWLPPHFLPPGQWLSAVAQPRVLAQAGCKLGWFWSSVIRVYQCCVCSLGAVVLRGKLELHSLFCITAAMLHAVSCQFGLTGMQLFLRCEVSSCLECQLRFFFSKSACWHCFSLYGPLDDTKSTANLDKSEDRPWASSQCISFVAAGTSGQYARDWYLEVTDLAVEEAPTLLDGSLEVESRPYIGPTGDRRVCVCVCVSK